MVFTGIAGMPVIFESFFSDSDSCLFLLDSFSEHVVTSEFFGVLFPDDLLVKCLVKINVFVTACIL